MPTCPNGHQSGSDDWCEVCGHRMAGAWRSRGCRSAAALASAARLRLPGPRRTPARRPPRPSSARSAAPRVRPCAPFCEECRYNFLTHTATSYTPARAAARSSRSGGLNLPPGFQSPARRPASAAAPLLRGGTTRTSTRARGPRR